MPKEIFNNNYKFLRRDDLMTFEENLMVVEALSELGLTKVRLTGGEPLLRKNIEKLINRRPIDYSWEYKRFKRSLPEEENLYSGI